MIISHRNQIEFRRRARSCRLIPTICVLLAASTAARAQKTLAPLPIKPGLDTFNFASFVPIDLSPDGQMVTYTLRDPRRARTEKSADSDPKRTGSYFRARYCDVWLTDIKTGKATNLTEGKGSSWGGVWSPDGKRLAFFSDRTGTQTVWIWERASGTIRQMSNLTVRVRDAKVARWTPDSRYLVVPFLPEGMTVESDAAEPQSRAAAAASHDIQSEPGSTVTVFTGAARDKKVDADSERLRLNGFLPGYQADLAVIDVSSGQLKRVAKRINLHAWWISPDGKNVAAWIAKGVEAPGTVQSIWDLAVISLTDGSSRNLVTNFKGSNAIPAAWSPDGKSLAYLTYDLQTGADCWIVDVAGGSPRNLTPGAHAKIDPTSRGPLWDAEGRYIYLISSSSLLRTSPATSGLEEVVKIPERTIVDIVGANTGGMWFPQTNSTILLMTRDEATKQEGIYTIDLASRRYARLFEENVSFGFFTFHKTDVSADNARMVYCVQKADQSEDIWMLNRDLTPPLRVTHINPVFDQYVMGQARVIEWQRADGVKIRGALLLPAGYQEGKRYPLIVYQYPGSNWSNYGNLFGFNLFGSAVENWQFFATRGYAVLIPDVPAKPETYMEDIARAVLPGLDKVIELGIADPDRLGITGQSNGGYGTLCLIVQTTRFRAAIDRAGPGNLISQFGQMQPDGRSVYIGESRIRTGGSLWEKRDAFIKNSPVFYFDRVQTPVLIFQGTADTQVMTPRSDEVFVTLRFLGKDVEYARYEGEGHGFGEWSYPNQVDYLNRAIAWFDKYLKESPKAETASK